MTNGQDIGMPPEPEKPEINFTISKITSRLLELFTQEMQRRIGLGMKITKADAIAFIIEDYTKGYYAKVSEHELS